jgi:hypothetical protein
MRIYEFGLFHNKNLLGTLMPGVDGVPGVRPVSRNAAHVCFGIRE